MINSQITKKRDLRAEQNEADKAFREWQDRYPLLFKGVQKPVTAEIGKGFMTSLPIVLGYLPISFAYGVLSASSGVSAFGAIGMSIFIFAGSSQFVAIGLISSGMNPLSIILTTFIINSRYFLMSAAILKYLRRWTVFQRFLFAVQMTDETFVINCSRLPHYPDSPARIFATNIFPHIVWILGTVAGFYANSLLPAPELLGLDFALPAMFIAMITLQMNSLLMLATALISVGLLILLQLTPFNNWAVMISAIIAALVGGLGELWEPRH